MTARAVVTSTALALVAAIASNPSRIPVVSTPVEAAQSRAGEPTTSTLDDQVELAVTVYNSQLALVRDVRTIRLGPGVSDLQFMDIAATVNAPTVHFRSISAPSSVSVLEQNYEYDLLDPQKLLLKYVGRDVTLVRRVATPGGGSGEDAVTATLLSYNGAPVWRINGEIVTGMSADHIRFPELPGNLHARPTLIWTVENRGGGEHQVEASYLAGKLSWNADYVLTLARDDKTADLDGWVTIVNASGTAFRNARLQLVAGDLNRVRPRFEQAVAEFSMRAAPAAAPAMAEESFSDYHLYTLGRKTSVNNNETKQVSMLNATGFSVQKRYVVSGEPYYFRSQRAGSATKDPVQVFYQLRNDAGSGLGMPLPAGIVRVYQADSKGGIQFVGEDRLAHTPKDETVNLKIGNAFDVTSERTQTDFTRISSDSIEFEYSLTLRNHTGSPVTIEVHEPIGGTWRMLRSTFAWTKTSAWSAQFTVPVAADGTSVLRYRVRATY